MSETPADNPENNVDSAEEQQMHVASRREKMRKIEELGLDPWESLRRSLANQRNSRELVKFSIKRKMAR